MSYNGWKNRETWEVSMLINNDEPLYRAAVEMMRKYTGRTPFKDFVRQYEILGDKFTNKNLSIAELNFMMWELRND